MDGEISGSGQPQVDPYQTLPGVDDASPTEDTASTQGTTNPYNSDTQGIAGNNDRPASINYAAGSPQLPPPSEEGVGVNNDIPTPPSIADSVDVEEIGQKVQADLVAKYGSPELEKLAEARGQTVGAFLESVQIAYDDSYESALKSAVDKGKITQDQASKLRTMHYMPDAFKDDAELQGFFETYNNAALKPLQSEFGIDENFTPPTDAGYYTQVTNGAFRNAFTDALYSQVPPISEADKQLILKAFEDPTGASPEIKELTQTIKEGAINQVIAQYGLEAGWEPKVTTITNPQMNNEMFIMAGNAINNLETMLAEAELQASDMPPDAKVSFLDYLKTISDHLGVLKEFMNAISGSDTDISKKIGIVASDITMTQLKRQQEATAKALAAKAPKKMSFFKKLTKWVTKIVTIVAALAFAAFIGGPIGIIMALATIGYLIDGIVHEVRLAKDPEALSGMTNMFNNLCKAVIKDKKDSGLSRVMAKLAGFIVTFAASILASGFNPVIFLSQFSGEAGLVRKFLCATVKDETTQKNQRMIMIGEAVGGAIVQCAAMVAMIAFSGGAAGGAMYVKMVQTLKTIVESTKMVSNAVKTMQALFIIYTISSGVAQTVMSAKEAEWQFTQADLKKLLSEIEASTEENKALADAIKKIVDMLLASIEGTSTEITTISDKQRGLWEGASGQLQG